MDVKARELKLWNDLLEHEARRECAIDHWVGELSGHAKALCRLGIIDEEELREMLELADAAYAHVSEELAHQEWLKAGRPGR
ncbi:hypothetical protein [Pseudomonas sp. W5-01]|uniref:hypothetical protein n=1 Tax=Pseudomonas sp. W5-01 TaxID=3097454 RepID=UPI003978EC7C